MKDTHIVHPVAEAATVCMLSWIDIVGEDLSKQRKKGEERSETEKIHQ